MLRGCGFRFPTSSPLSYGWQMRRKIEKEEFEFGLIAFCVVVPAGFWIVHTLLAILTG